MEPKKIALLVGALVVAAMAAVMAKNMFGQSATPQAQAMVVAAPVGPEVLVATRMLPVGTIIQPDSFRYQPWPKDLVENAYYIKGSADPASLAGTVVRADITAGQPVTQGSLVAPGDRGFLAAALGAGMRAVTVAVSNQTGVAGFVFPGDRIDLVLTQAVPGGGDGPPLKVSETIVRNMRVLATDQRTDNVVGEDGKTEVKTFTSVTDEATPNNAEQIAVAQTLGSLSLSLRSLADNSTELEQAIASGSIHVPDGADPKAEHAMMVQLATQPASGNPSFATGADVSRYQRRTVPGKTPVAPSGAPAGAPTPGTGSSFPGGGPAPTGPIVRVARGNSMTAVPVGGSR